ncbi:hypothetical protein D3C77_80730 [compost metagenome]
MHDVQSGIRSGHLDLHTGHRIQHLQRAADDVAPGTSIDHRVGVRGKHADDDPVRPVGRKLARASRHADCVVDELVRRGGCRPGQVGGHSQLKPGRTTGARPNLWRVEPVDVRRICRQISAWWVDGEGSIRAQGNQRGLTHFHLGQRDVVLAFGHIQQHLHALVPRCDIDPARLGQVRRVGALVPGNLSHRFTQLDLVALGACLGDRVALLGARTGRHAWHLRHDRLEHCLGALEQSEGDGERVSALGLAEDLEQVGRFECHLVPVGLLDHLIIQHDADRRALAAFVRRSLALQPLLDRHSAVGLPGAQGRRVTELVRVELDHGNTPPLGKRLQIRQ